VRRFGSPHRSAASGKVTKQTAREKNRVVTRAAPARGIFNVNSQENP